MNKQEIKVLQEKFRKLEENWDGEDAEKISERHIRIFPVFVKAWEKYTEIKPHISPDRDGSLELYYNEENQAFIFKINNFSDDRKIGEFYYINRVTGISFSGDLKRDNWYRKEKKYLKEIREHNKNFIKGEKNV